MYNWMTQCHRDLPSGCNGCKHCMATPPPEGVETGQGGDEVGPGGGGGGGDGGVGGGGTRGDREEVVV